MAVSPDFRASTFKAFLAAHVAPGATLHTDGLTSFGAAAIEGYRHVPRRHQIRELSRRGVLNNLRELLNEVSHQLSLFWIERLAADKLNSIGCFHDRLH